MILLSITGLFKTVLIIIGIAVIMRFIGKLMIAKRAVDEHSQHQKSMEKQAEMINDAKNNFGKISLSKNQAENNDDFTPYEEVKE